MVDEAACQRFTVCKGEILPGINDDESYIMKDKSKRGIEPLFLF